MPMILVLIPLALVALQSLPLGRLRGGFTFISAMTLCAALVAASFIPLDHTFWRPNVWMLANLAPGGITIDSLSKVMFLSIGIVAIAAISTAKYTIADSDRRSTLVQLVLLAVAGMNGIILSSDLFTMYIFIEVTAVASFVLIAFDREKDAYEGAFKYIILSAVASAMMLSALALLFSAAGGLSFGAIRSALAADAASTIAIVAVGIFLCGLFIKAGLVPFHWWIPDAYSSAPSAVSVLLAGIVTKASGVYTLMRLVSDVFGFSEKLQALLIIAGLASIAAGAFAAILQSDFRRMLAYSSISQVGYIILGLASGSALGFAGATLHLFNHATFKSILFINAASVERQTGIRDMNMLGGIAERMPVTGLTSAIAFLSTAGIPPLAGFWSKLIIIIAVWQAGFVTSAAAAILLGLVTLAYFLYMQRRVFFGKLRAGFEGVREAGFWACAPALLLSGTTVAVGFMIPWLFGTFLLPVRSIL